MVSNNKFAGVSYIALELPLFTMPLNQLRKEMIPAIEAIKLSKIKQLKGKISSKLDGRNLSSEHITH